MKSLIAINKDNSGNSTVSARELYEFLEVKSNFSTWCKRMFEYGFEENKDYVSLSFFGKRTRGGQNEIDYALTIDTSKEIAMLQRSEKGKQARTYFLECEKQLKEVRQLTPAEQLLANAQILVEQERRISTIEEKVLEIEAKTTTRPEYFTIMGYAILQNVKVGLSIAAQLGRRAKALCTEKGYHIDTISDPRFGKVGCYPKEVLNQVFTNFTF